MDPLHEASFVVECAEGILNGLSDPVIGIDREGCIKTCNAAGAGLIGRTIDDLIGRPLAEVFCAENAWIVDRVGAVRMNNQSARVESALLSFGGHPRKVNATICPLTSAEHPEPLGTLVMLKEIGAGKQIAAPKTC